ncbi:glutaredoxin family protein [Halobacillus shinanisalinarum]|uniref:Glutaredoxin family protein n=1 Tax=Halobacillus shinanisalinarum TaxID=2932258 RepID=A0ABY4GUT0_9BACI|nr:glutaredoxin family protein [Halobacillus shinanisalinarum]UOQ91789.1 glutaredoxin family protein [Halobacillus shinanisalinarum]
MNKQKVVVYTSNGCSQCERVLSMLSEWNVAFEERNITGNKRNFKDLQAQGIYATPATMIDNEKILGYQERQLKRTLGVH